MCHALSRLWERSKTVWLSVWGMYIYWDAYISPVRCGMHQQSPWSWAGPDLQALTTHPLRQCVAKVICGHF